MSFQFALLGGKIPGVGAWIGRERMRLLVQIVDPVRSAVEERAVVRDDDRGAGEVPQPGLQPFERVDVEVVGGLIKEQQVVLAE